MYGSHGGTVDWQRLFAEIIISGDTGEISAAAEAAAAAIRQGASEAAAKDAGKQAARRYREARAGWTRPRPGWGRPEQPPPNAAFGNRVRAAESPPATGAVDWPNQLAARLFNPPARWGWQAAPVVAPPVTPAPRPRPRPEWIESPVPDSSALRAARSSAVTKVVWRVAFMVIAVVAFTTYRLTIEERVGAFGSDAEKIYGVAVLVIGGVLVLGLLRAINAVRRASGAITAFERPYRTLRAAERDRHRQAVREWEEEVRLHEAERAAAAREASRLAAGPQWYPVHPAARPTRVDVFGGDPHRHGWAGLLVTLGCSVLAGGNRLTLLDFTGQDVGGGLARVAQARGLYARRVDLDADTTDVDLLQGLSRRAVAPCLAYALTGREGADQRQERALATDVLHLVIDCLVGAVTFDRLAAGIQVLQQGAIVDELSPSEVSALASRVGDIDQNEWTTRQLRFLASQLRVLGAFAPATYPVAPLWTKDPVSVIATDGGRDDRKELIDRLVVQLAQQAMADEQWPGGLLIVAGADHLGARTLENLSALARHAGVQLVLMIDQPQGDVEKSVGTGGAVCVMKMYNHRDATIAAEFIGKGHRFVVSQVTRQTGKTFSEGGNDSFAANTGQGSSTSSGRSGGSGINDSRGHAWTGGRNWSAADNISTSEASSRVYEFVVGPEEILDMPETAFILVDNSGQYRRVLMADGNPGICLRDRVSATMAR